MRYTCVKAQCMVIKTYIQGLNFRLMPDKWKIDKSSA